MGLGEHMKLPVVSVCSQYFDGRPFEIPKWQISLPFYVLEIRTLLYIWSPVKGTPFGRSLPV